MTPSATSKRAPSRFWLTFAALWLVGCLSVVSVHSLVHEWEGAHPYATSTHSLPMSHSHPEDACVLCQLGHLPLVAMVVWQLIVTAALCLLSATKLFIEAGFYRIDITPISRRGPPPPFFT